MNNNKQQPEQLDPTKVFEDMLGERLCKTKFEITPEQRAHIAKIQDPEILKMFSVLEMSGDIDNYQRLLNLNPAEDLTLMDASFFLNAANRLSPADMGKTLSEYVDFLKANDEIVLAWNTIVTPLKTSVMRETRAKLDRKIITPKNNLKIHKN